MKAQWKRKERSGSAVKTQIIANENAVRTHYNAMEAL
jgi:hypothetical protein